MGLRSRSCAGLLAIDGVGLEYLCVQRVLKEVLRRKRSTMKSKGDDNDAHRPG